jgi:hypothetical protein
VAPAAPTDAAHPAFPPGDGAGLEAAAAKRSLLRSKTFISETDLTQLDFESGDALFSEEWLCAGFPTDDIGAVGIGGEGIGGGSGGGLDGTVSLGDESAGQNLPNCELCHRNHILDRWMCMRFCECQFHEACLELWRRECRNLCPVCKTGISQTLFFTLYNGRMLSSVDSGAAESSFSTMLEEEWSQPSQPSKQHGPSPTTMPSTPEEEAMTTMTRKRHQLQMLLLQLLLKEEAEVGDAVATVVKIKVNRSHVRFETLSDNEVSLRFKRSIRDVVRVDKVDSTRVALTFTSESERTDTADRCVVFSLETPDEEEEEGQIVQFFELPTAGEADGLYKAVALALQKSAEWSGSVSDLTRTHLADVAAGVGTTSSGDGSDLLYQQLADKLFELEGSESGDASRGGGIDLHTASQYDQADDPADVINGGGPSGDDKHASTRCDVDVGSDAPETGGFEARVTISHGSASESVGDGYGDDGNYMTVSRLLLGASEDDEEC